MSTPGYEWRRSLASWAGVTTGKFYDWRKRYGRVNEHNGWVPRDFWLEPWKKEAIIGFHRKSPLEGYRRLTSMMLDHDIVAVSPASVRRVLEQAGLLSVARAASRLAAGVSHSRFADRIPSRPQNAVRMIEIYSWPKKSPHRCEF